MLLFSRLTNALRVLTNRLRHDRVVISCKRDARIVVQKVTTLAEGAELLFLVEWRRWLCQLGLVGEVDGEVL